ncbi:MAG TPA: ABC transporter ATP-binding protein [Acholeplasmataceae bacterium]|jgi:ABC-2 type transport system ATP-binding protein|nr:ABC transporter ATP-binding protein [Acholeplasmataceae bacterium]
MSILKISNLTKSYSGFIALKNVNFEFEKGKIYGLLGPNGSGKTTLIKIINGLLQPTNGDVLINGKKPGIESKKIISYLPERTYFNQNMKVKEAIEYFKDFYKDFDDLHAIKLIESFHIPIEKILGELSKGMKEKIQLALVVSRRADIYIFDEPIAGVDPASRDLIMRTIIQSLKEDSTVIISTHLIQDVEKILDEVIMINYGEIVLSGNADELREKEGKSIDGIFREVFRC